MKTSIYQAPNTDDKRFEPAGPGTILTDDLLPYPRLCAHRGFSTVAPENTLPAYGAAVALGAEEIELDVWGTTDGVLVSCHDPELDRVSDGSGKIYEKSYEELLKLDFGFKFGDKFKGLKIPTFEEILEKFSGRTIMNVHIKIWDLPELNPMIEEIVALIRKYGAEKYCYLQTSATEMVRQVMEYAPDIKCALGWNGHETDMELVDRAIELGAYKIQFFKPHYSQEAVDKAHEHGILCNIFWADDPEEAQKFFDMGMDQILTNDFHYVAHNLGKY